MLQHYTAECPIISLKEREIWNPDPALELNLRFHPLPCNREKPKLTAELWKIMEIKKISWFCLPALSLHLFYIIPTLVVFITWGHKALRLQVIRPLLATFLTTSENCHCVCVTKNHSFGSGYNAVELCDWTPTKNPGQVLIWMAG